MNMTSQSSETTIRPCESCPLTTQGITRLKRLAGKVGIDSTEVAYLNGFDHFRDEKRYNASPNDIIYALHRCSYTTTLLH